MNEQCARLLGSVLFITAAAATWLHAEDADRFRPYLRFHSGDIEPRWGVDDHWSLGLGANFNRYLGAELAFDYFSRDWGEPENVAEVSIYNVVPELRVRYPLFKDRLVPYFLAGIGPSWMQDKDNKTTALQKRVRVDGYSYAVAVGGGLEYFIADNVTFGIEGKYLWVNPIDGTVDGQTQTVDMSSPLFTFGLRIYFDENKALPLVAQEPDPTSRLYFGVRLGVNFDTGPSWSSGGNFDPEQAAWGGVASQTGGFGLGVDIGRHLGFELSADHINRVISVDGLGDTTEYGQGWILASLRLRYPMGRWVPYALIGGGVSYGELKDQKLGSLGMHNTGGGAYPALGVGGGLEYFVIRNFSLNAEARWAYSWGHKYGIEGVIPETRGDLSYVAATIGFRVYLLDL